MRVRAYDDEAAQVVGDVLDTAGGDALGLAQRAAVADNGVVVLLHPAFPGGDAVLRLRFALGFGQRHPCGHARMVLAADENGEIETGRRHDAFLSLCESEGRNRSST